MLKNRKRRKSVGSKGVSKSNFPPHSDSHPTSSEPDEGDLSYSKSVIAETSENVNNDKMNSFPSVPDDRIGHSQNDQSAQISSEQIILSEPRNHSSFISCNDASGISITDALCKFALARAKADTDEKSSDASLNRIGASPVTDSHRADDKSSDSSGIAVSAVKPLAVLSSSVLSTSGKIPFLSETTDEINSGQHGSDSGKITSVSETGGVNTSQSNVSQSVNVAPAVINKSIAGKAVCSTSGTVSTGGSEISEVLQQHWQCVKNNQYDFAGWTQLLQYIESTADLNEVRRVYNAFLPVFPCCFAYWKKYAEMEYKLDNHERAFQVLECAVSVMPLSIDIWLTYLNLYDDFAARNKLTVKEISVLYERAADSAGRQFPAERLWERIMSWAETHTDPSYLFKLSRRLIQIPMRMSNKHWENLMLIVEKNSPHYLLSYSEYCDARERCCLKLGIDYQEDMANKDIIKCIKSSKRDSSLANVVREDLVQRLKQVHTITSTKVDKILKMEDKIKRPYFHVVPLEKRQLRNWRDYLEFEMKEALAANQLSSVVVLYERCLVACAQYEDFWMMYGSFLERVLNSKEAKMAKFKTSRENSVDSSSETAAVKTERSDSIDESGCVQSEPTDNLKSPKSETSGDPQNTPRNEDSDQLESCKVETDDSVQIDKNNDDRCVDSGVGQPPANCTESVPLPSQEYTVELDISLENISVETIRNVYKRACLVHCPNKPNLRLQWACFEEQHGDINRARELTAEVCESHPRAVKPRLQLIGLERRQANYEQCSVLYQKAMESSEELHMRTWWSMKHARFHFKILHKPDKALSILRNALKKDRCNARLFNHILDICYQRNPVDIKGVGAVLTLALSNKDLSLADRVTYMRKRVEFYEEFGSVEQLRSAEMSLVEADRQLQQEEKRLLKEQEQLKAKSDAKSTEAEPSDNPKAAKRKRKADEPQTGGNTLDVCPGCKLNLKDPVAVGLAKNITSMSLPPMNQPPPTMMQSGAPPVFFPAPGTGGEYANWNPQACYGPFPTPTPNFPVPPSVAHPSNHMMPSSGMFAGPVMAPPSNVDATPANFSEQTIVPSSLPPTPMTANPVTPTNITCPMNPAPALNNNAPANSNAPMSGPVSTGSTTVPNAAMPVKSQMTAACPQPNGVVPQHVLGIDPMVNSAPLQCATGIGVQNGAGDCPPFYPQLQSHQQHPMPPIAAMNCWTPHPNMPPPQGPQMLRPPFMNPMMPSNGGPTGSMSMPPCLNVPGWFVERGGPLCLSETPRGRSILHYWPRFMSEKGYTRMLDSLMTCVNWRSWSASSMETASDGPPVKSTAIQRYVAWFSHRAPPADFDQAICTKAAPSGDTEDMVGADEWPPELNDLAGRLGALTELELNSCALTLYRSGRDFSPWRRRSSDTSSLLAHPATVIVSLGAVRPLELQSSPTLGGGGDCGAPVVVPETFIRLSLPAGSVLVLDGCFHEDWTCRVPVDQTCQGEHVSLHFINMRE